MTDVTEAAAWGRAQLEAAGVPGAARDATVLLEASDVGGAPTMSAAQMAAYRAAIDRRSRREPVSHILGRRAFWMHEFRVTSDVLDPRPDTETLVAAARDLGVTRFQNPERWPNGAQPDWPPVSYTRVLDLGTGSGCILMSLLHEAPDATGVGVDLSPAALEVAAQNARITGVEGRVELMQSDWFSAVEGRFDLIVSNPPYIAQAEMADLAPEVSAWEPHLALTPGADGLAAYKLITAQAQPYLTPGGTLMVEVGATQADAVAALFEAAGFAWITRHSDLDGRDRVISGEKPR